MNHYKITNVSAREVFNGIWVPTVEVTVEVGNGISGTSIAPTGQSTGMHEAVEVRDGGERYDGMGCKKAVANIEGELRDLLIGMDVTEQRVIDSAMNKLDGTANKGRLGANAIVATSAAVTAAAAKAVGLPVYRYVNGNAHVLPVPMMDFISGSHYAFGASSEIQEFSVLPVGADSFTEAMDISWRLYCVLRNNIVERYGALGQCVDAAGSFALPIKTCRESFDFLLKALDMSGMFDKFMFGMDCASSYWYDKEKKIYNFEGKPRTREEMMEYYRQLVKNYPIITMEDPFDETDTEGFVMATKELGIQIVGDDFFVTNPKIMREKMLYGAANALLWKYNQIGTLSEAYDAAELAARSGYGVMASERSGESEDNLLADLTVGINAGQCKCGICVRSENVAKYNRLLKIEKELGKDAVYAGHNFRNPGLGRQEERYEHHKK